MCSGIFPAVSTFICQKYRIVVHHNIVRILNFAYFQQPQNYIISMILHWVHCDTTSISNVPTHTGNDLGLADQQ